jgi:LuxR family maltose regulon positive regulatory protein
MAQKWTEAQGEGWGEMVAAAGLHLGLGTVLYQINDLESAAPHLERAVELYDLSGLWSRFYAYRMLAYLKFARGEHKDSYDLVIKTLAIKDKIIVHQTNALLLPSIEQLCIKLSRVRPQTAHLLADIARRIEKAVQANGELSYHNIDFTGPGGYKRELDYMNMAQVLIAQGRAAEALPLLERLLEAARLMGRQGNEMYYLVLIALAHHATGDNPSALVSLSQALILAEPQGYVRLFVDEGKPMAELLGLAISQDIAPDYASKLLAAFPEDIGSIAAEPSTQHLVEPLSEREIEVLRLIAAGYKYIEVAERLVISLNTVRHHTKNVYSKLNVNSRPRAIEKAKELDLL